MDLSQMNVELFRIINDFGKEHTYLNHTFIFLAEYMVFVLGLMALIFWFTRRKENRFMIISAAAAFIMAEIIGKIAGKLHSNNQPFAELSNVNKLIEKAVDNSFPSDHTPLDHHCPFGWRFPYMGGGTLSCRCLGWSANKHCFGNNRFLHCPPSQLYKKVSIAL